jgi:hypothetical protein
MSRNKYTSSLEFHMFYILYPFVAYLLTISYNVGYYARTPCLFRRVRAVLFFFFLVVCLKNELRICCEM